jgi:uncharacterized protein (TIGR04255 family)
MWWVRPTEKGSDSRMPHKPHFRLKCPPVVEVVVGVQFNSLPKLSAGHLGAFWRELAGEWPNVEDAPALPQQFEHFGDENALPFFAGLRLQLMPKPELRLQARNGANDRMVQIQNGRLHYNWLRQEEAEYPSYGKVKLGFDKIVTRFAEFLEQEGLGKFEPNQWELTYVDHIPKGTLWESPEDWPRIFRAWNVAPFRAPGIAVESLEAEWHYEIEPNVGRLHLKIARGRTAKREDVLIINTTARGPVRAGDATATLDRGLARGHEAVRTAFETLTSDSAQQYWGADNE